MEPILVFPFLYVKAKFNINDTWLSFPQINVGNYRTVTLVNILFHLRS